MYTDLQSVASPLGHSTKMEFSPASGESLRADDGTRTRDPHLGKVMLYQLSHVRTVFDSTLTGSASDALETIAELSHPTQTDRRFGGGHAPRYCFRCYGRLAQW